MSYIIRKTFNHGTTGIAAQITCTVTPSADVSVGTITELGTSGAYYADITITNSGNYAILWSDSATPPGIGVDEISTLIQAQTDKLQFTTTGDDNRVQVDVKQIGGEAASAAAPVAFPASIGTSTYAGGAATPSDVTSIVEGLAHVDEAPDLSQIESDLAAAKTAAEAIAATVEDSKFKAEAFENLNLGAGVGDAVITIKCEVNGLPVDGVAVRLSTDLEGLEMVRGPIYSNDAGMVEFYVEPPVTYYVWRQRAPINFTNPIKVIWNAVKSQYELEES